MSATPPDVIERQLLGTWKMVQTEGLDQLREAFNLTENTVPDNPECETQIIKVKDGVYTFVDKTAWGVKTVTTELGKPQVDTIMGRELNVVTTWDGRRLVTNIVGNKSDVNLVSREVVDGKLHGEVRFSSFVIRTVSVKI